MKPWKELEKTTAKKLGGKRVLRGANFSQSLPDVEHPLLSIECKYRKRISQFLKDGIKQAEEYYPDKIPALVLKERHQRGAFILLKLSDFEDLFGEVKT
ncbi:MAG TPA: hypothetical protein ENH85_00380 [Candidatus Scalindua sp.]|nr:hypothetical protein [Candidatus Scalindua sp.]